LLVTCLKCNRHVETGEASPGDVVKCACGLGIMVPEGPASAGKMNCPACGAPVDPALRKCNFCDTRLATVICPTCFGAVFDGAKHCEHCGETLENRKVIHHGDQVKHSCPRCKTEPAPQLRVEVVAGCPLERCPECEGLWIDRETVERLYEDRDNSPTIQAMTKSSKPEAKADGKSKVTFGEGYIKCPECSNLMHRQNFGRFSGVIIDYCKAHGTWFDADELRHILEFIQSGGLDKAAEREKMELKEELRWLRQKQNIERASDSMQVSMGTGLGSRRAGDRLVSESIALGIGGLLRRLFR
jgi:Zn-finger nucleic acid-binding protein